MLGLEEGRDWEPSFVPFSLSQVHVDEGAPAVWEGASLGTLPSGVLALAWGIAVRDGRPDLFPEFHLGVFRARHDEGKDINRQSTLEQVAAGTGLDAGEIAATVASGEPLETLAAEHTRAVEEWRVFGVPTFIEGNEAVFVRLMERGRSDDVEHVLSMLSWNRLNEFKRTVVPR